jgi:predicted metalloprotease
MRLEDERESDRVVDHRGAGPGGRRGRGIRMGVAGGGIGAMVLLVLALLLGVDPSVLLQGDRDAGRPDIEATSPGPGEAPTAEGQALRRFVSRVLATTEDAWAAVFQENGQVYDPPRLVLFEGAVRSACGAASSAVGPFYCPADRQLYLDLGFLGDMARQLGAPGDFAQAYVIAHEVGHHVQTEIGITERVEALRRRLPPDQANALSVRVELQADCFAGIWANRASAARPILEEGDIAEGLNAAAAVGDDRLQRRSQGHVVPESFTHGSAQQRMRWFRRGLESGRVEDCDTFAAGTP